MNTIRGETDIDDGNFRNGAATEERIVAIEKKMRDLEALVKGLTQELLDLKSVAMKMSKQTEERSRAELKRAQPGTPGYTTAAGHSSRIFRIFKHGGHAKGCKTLRGSCGAT